MLSGCLANLPREGSLRAHDCQWTPQNWPFQDSLLGSQSFRALRTYVIHMSTNSQLRKFWHQFRQQLRFQVFFFSECLNFRMGKTSHNQPVSQAKLSCSNMLFRIQVRRWRFRGKSAENGCSSQDKQRRKTQKATTFFFGKETIPTNDISVVCWLIVH